MEGSRARVVVRLSAGCIVDALLQSWNRKLSNKRVLGMSTLYGNENARELQNDLILLLRLRQMLLLWSRY